MSTPPPDGMRTFVRVLVNTALANVTTSYLWFALTFWVYLETRSVLATGIIGGAYMLLVALFSMLFGTIVDRHRKHRVMILAEHRDAHRLRRRRRALPALPGVAAARHRRAGVLVLHRRSSSFGAVVENMRNIALSTTVTLLVPEERHANANGLVGTVQGLAFTVTSVFSGLSIGLLGMGWTLADRDRAHGRRPRAPAVPAHPRRRSRSAGRRAAAADRPPRQHHGGAGGHRALRPHHLLDVQQPHRRRLHGAHGPVRSRAVRRRVVGRRARRHLDRASSSAAC